MKKSDREWLEAIRAALETSRLNLLDFINENGATSGLAVALEAVETAQLEVDYLLKTGDLNSEVQS
tara:strand:+ start:778 stop:975 length:198 start_codon:yes stop_codon:yes gene_type:complete